MSSVGYTASTRTLLANVGFKGHFVSASPRIFFRAVEHPITPPLAGDHLLLAGQLIPLFPTRCHQQGSSSVELLHPAMSELWGKCCPQFLATALGLEDAET